MLELQVTVDLLAAWLGKKNIWEGLYRMEKLSLKWTPFKWPSADNVMVFVTAAFAVQQILESQGWWKMQAILNVS